MIGKIYTKIYSPEELGDINIKEVLRYMRGTADEPTLSLVDDCIAEAAPILVYKICYGYAGVEVKDGAISFPFGVFESEKLAKNLDGCSEAVVFGATIGLELDRLIAKYGRLSPSKGVALQALGAERIEALCDRFNDEISAEEALRGRSTKPRFSPGYGDLALEHQREIFDFLDCNRKIGLSLNDSMLMSPSKSVTAIIGVHRGGVDASSAGCDDGARDASAEKCRSCSKTDCEFRRI